MLMAKVKGKDAYVISEAELQGFLDLFDGDLLERIGADGFASVLKLIQAIRQKPINTDKLLEAIQGIAKVFKLDTDVKEFADIIAEMKEEDWWGAGAELGEFITAVCNHFRKSPLPGKIGTTPVVFLSSSQTTQTSKKKNLFVGSRIDAQKWLKRESRHMARGMRGLRGRYARRVIANHFGETSQEYLAICSLTNPEMYQVKLTKEQWKRVLENVIPVLRGLSMSFPPYSLVLLIVAQALQWIVNNRLTPEELIAAMKKIKKV